MVQTAWLELWSRWLWPPGRGAWAWPGHCNGCAIVCCRRSDQPIATDTAMTQPIRLLRRTLLAACPGGRARPGAVRRVRRRWPRKPPSSSSSTGASRAPAPFFLLPVAQGQFKAEKLNVSIDAGNGSGNAVNRVASGTYDMGFADLAALMEFHANNPTAPNKPVAVMMVYNNTPCRGVQPEEDRHHQARRPGRQEAGGHRCSMPAAAASRSSRRPTASAPVYLDQHGPAAARDHAGQG